MRYCGTQLHGRVVYGYGLPPLDGVRLAPKNSTRSLPHFHNAGVRHGADFHRRGFASQYGYINGRVPVLIKRIYWATLVVDDEEHSFVCAIVRRFRVAAQPANFPWSEWYVRVLRNLAALIGLLPPGEPN